MRLRERGERCENARGEYESDGYTQLRPARIEVAVLRRGVLERHQSRSAPFASHREALYESQRDKEDGRHYANLLERRQEPDQEGRPAHQEKRGDEHGLATEPIAEMAKDGSADRTGEKADAERGE